MKDINYINLKYKGLIINQDKRGYRMNSCYSKDGNCRDCRYYKDCKWFKDMNGYS